LGVVFKVVCTGSVHGKHSVGRRVTTEEEEEEGNAKKGFLALRLLVGKWTEGK